jgi:hypothetical protein
MITARDIPPSLSRLDPDAMLAVGREAGLSPPTSEDIPVARALASKLMDHEVVSEATLLAVLAIQPASLLVFREEGDVTGVYGQLLLGESAVRAIFSGTFDALEVDIGHLSRAGETPALGYVWGLAASTKKGGAAILSYGRLVRPRLFPNLTVFTRAVTPIGRHIALNRYGYQPLRGPDDDLMVHLPNAQSVAA